MKFLGGIFLVVWGLAFHFLRKCAELSGLPGLSGREQERLVWKLRDIRRRVWWIGGVAVLSGFLVWLIGSIPSLGQSRFAPISIGLLLGVGLSHLVVIPGWFNELYAFTDAIRLREERKRRAEAALKEISEAKKGLPGNKAAAG